MNDKTKEPIDLQKRRAEKLLEHMKHGAGERTTQSEGEWPGSAFTEDTISIHLSEELLDRVRIMIRAIASKAKKADSIADVERSCFGLALLLLRDIDSEAYDRLFKLVSEKENLTV